MLFALGSNGNGQLGIGHLNDVSSPEPVLLNVADKVTIKHVASGGNHTVFLLEDGHVHGCGRRKEGQLGFFGNTQCTEVLSKPVEIQLASNQTLANIQNVTATWSTSHFLTCDGTLLVCGEGRNGELGLGEGIVRASQPQCVSDFPPAGTKIVQLSSCMAHTVALLDNGDLFGWGNGRNGQLGLPLTSVWRPRKITMPADFRPAKAVCGKDFTCIIEAPHSGRILLLGPDRRDRFNIQEKAPSAVPDWRSIAATWGSVYVLEASRRLTAWGRNDHGQLPPSHIPAVQMIVAGSEHCLALTEAGPSLAWGWGEHGNCGVLDQGPNGTKVGYNTVHLMDRAQRLYAGCATSFLDDGLIE